MHCWANGARGGSCHLGRPAARLHACSICGELPRHCGAVQSVLEFSQLCRLCGWEACCHPANSGSLFYNYKGTCSIVLLAVQYLIAHYLLRVTDGRYGRASDGWTIYNSAFGEKTKQGGNGSQFVCRRSPWCTQRELEFFIIASILRFEQITFNRQALNKWHTVDILSTSSISTNLNLNFYFSAVSFSLFAYLTSVLHPPK